MFLSLARKKSVDISSGEDLKRKKEVKKKTTLGKKRKAIEIYHFYVLISSYSPCWCRRDPTLNNMRWWTRDGGQMRLVQVYQSLTLAAWGADHPTPGGAAGRLHPGAECTSPSCGRKALWEQGDEVTPGPCRRRGRVCLNKHVGWQGHGTCDLRGRVCVAGWPGCWGTSYSGGICI